MNHPSHAHLANVQITLLLLLVDLIASPRLEASMHGEVCLATLAPTHEQLDSVADPHVLVITHKLLAIVILAGQGHLEWVLVQCFQGYRVRQFQMAPCLLLQINVFIL